MTTQVKLKNVRLAFFNGFKATKGKGDDPNKPATFNTALLFPPGHAAEKILEDAEKIEAEVKWGPKGAATLVQLRKAGKNVVHDGDAKEYDGYAGNLYVTSRNQKRPRIVDTDGTPLSAEDGRPYSGCFADVILDIWAQDNEFGKRINASLAGVQFRRHGDAFGGGGTPLSDDAFEAITDEDDLV